MGLEKRKDNQKKFNISLLSEDEDFAEGEDIWVTPGIPLLIFITIGFIIAVFYGDLLSLLIRIP